jgi:hypothetical protein
LPDTAPGDVDAALGVTYDFYEQFGGVVIRWLADEQRVAAMHERLQVGRQHLHRRITAIFMPVLERRKGAARGQLNDALVVAFDVYTWKLLRRDFGLDRRAAQAVVRSMIVALTREDEHG